MATMATTATKNDEARWVSQYYCDRNIYLFLTLSLFSLFSMSGGADVVGDISSRAERVGFHAWFLEF
jgi:hypothetical protein